MEKGVHHIRMHYTHSLIQLYCIHRKMQNFVATCTLKVNSLFSGEELNKHIASVPILLIVLNNLYIVCLSIEINMFKLILFLLF